MTEPQSGVEGANFVTPTGTETPPENTEGVTPKEDAGQEKPKQKLIPQDQVNAIVAEEKRKYQEKMEKLKSAGLSDEQIQKLEKEEEAVNAGETLESVRKERVELILDQNKDLVEKLEESQVEKLRNAPVQNVNDFFSSLRPFIKKEEAPAPAPAGGEIPSIESGSPQIQNIPKGDLELAEGIQTHAKTGNPTRMVEALFRNLKL